MFRRCVSVNLCYEYQLCYQRSSRRSEDGAGRPRYWREKYTMAMDTWGSVPWTHAGPHLVNTQLWLRTIVTPHQAGGMESRGKTARWRLTIDAARSRCTVSFSIASLSGCIAKRSFQIFNCMDRVGCLVAHQPSRTVLSSQ